MKKTASALMATSLLGGCMFQVRDAEAPGQNVIGATYTDGYHHRILGTTTATARGEFCPWLLPLYPVFGISSVEGGYRRAQTQGWPFPALFADPVEEAARFDALEKVPQADLLISVRVRKESRSWIFDLWRTETVTVSAKAVALQD